MSFIVERLNRKKSSNDSQEPLFVGLNGAQGSGKTTLVGFTELASKLLNQIWIEYLAKLYTRLV